MFWSHSYSVVTALMRRPVLDDFFFSVMSSSDLDKAKRMGRWYFGGVASAGAACCTHPLDLLKVHLQTAGKGDQRVGLVSRTVGIVRAQGVLALYNGLSASLVRQLTYSTTRFAIYEVSTVKKIMD